MHFSVVALFQFDDQLRAFDLRGQSSLTSAGGPLADSQRVTFNNTGSFEGQTDCRVEGQQDKRLGRYRNLTPAPSPSDGEKEGDTASRWSVTRAEGTAINSAADDFFCEQEWTL